MHSIANDILEIFKISVIFFISASAFYLPLKALTNSEIAQKLTIPVSISTQILFGYLFYSFFKISYYPICYLGLIVVLNVIALIKTKPAVRPVRIKLNWQMILIGMILVGAVAYHFFFDAFINYSPGTIDTMNHVNYLFGDLNKLGFLSFSSYPPGFHILLYPLTYISSQVPVYRFAGSLIGITTLISLFLIYKDIFKHKISIALLTALMILPIFNQLTLQLIGFWPTALSFIFVSFLIFTVLEREMEIKIRILTLLIVFTAMGITIPYLSVQLIPCMIILSIYAFINYRKKDKRIYHMIVLSTLAVIFSFFIGFAHTYLQSTILKRAVGFPAIDTVQTTDAEITVTTNYQKQREFVERLPKTLKVIAQTNLCENYILPMTFTGIDIARTKNIREAKGALSIGAYGLILIALACAILKRKEVNIAILSVFVVIFGLSVQTGALEMDTYRGRSGYYMLFFSVLLIASLIDHYYKNKYRNVLLLVIMSAVIASILAPARYYRDYYPEYYEITQKILEQNPHSDVLIKTDRASLSSMSPEITTEALSPTTELDQCQHEHCFLILEKNYLWLDPILSQRSYAADRGGILFNEWQKNASNDQQSLTQSLLDSPAVKAAPIYYENQNIIVYEIKNR